MKLCAPRVVLVMLSCAATIMFTACTLLVDTDGFSGDDAVDAAPEGAAVDGATDTTIATDAGSEGPMGDAAPDAKTKRVTQGLIALYAFEESSGSKVLDTSGVEPALDLTIGDTSKTSRVPGGLSITGSTIVTSGSAATKIISRCKLTNEVSLEAWALPANLTQMQARLVAVAADLGVLDVVAAQSGREIDNVLRTNVSSATLTTTGAPITGQLVHVVTTRAASGKRFTYVDKKPAATGTLGGDFSSWDTSFPLVIANTPTLAAPWLGTIYLVAVYDRALTAAEVTQNFEAGP